MRKVTVWMEGGVIHDVDLPPGVSLELRDYDVEGVDMDDPRITEDSDGAEYLKIEFEPEVAVDPLLAALRNVLTHYAPQSLESDAWTLSGNSQTDAILRDARAAIAAAE